MIKIEGPVSWDLLITMRLEIIPMLVQIFDVNEDYITYNCEFMRAVKANNTNQAICALNNAIDRINYLSK